MKALSYVAAPYAAETPELVAWNIARAVLIARVLVSEGRAPVVVHPTIAPVFGEETPAARAVGIACDCAIVSAVAARSGAEFVALLRDDDTCSTGMSEEYAAWCDVRRQVLRDLPRSTASGVRAGNWRWWRQACARAGLLSEWADLLDAPGNARMRDCILCGARLQRGEALATGPASGPRGRILHDGETSHASCLETIRSGGEV